MNFENFWVKVHKTPTCWLWTGCKVQDGYGRFNMNGTVMNAHRASYIIHFGTFNKSLFVCHTCDIRHCVNPGHLFLGTNADNMADMIKKGRKFTKVTHQDIEDIKDWKRAGYKQLHIAKAYGISTALTSLIINNHRWQLPTY